MADNLFSIRRTLFTTRDGLLILYDADNIFDVVRIIFVTCGGLSNSQEADDNLWRMLLCSVFNIRTDENNVRADLQNVRSVLSENVRLV